MATYKEKEAQKDWEAHKKSIEQATVIDSTETHVEKKARIDRLLKDGNEKEFLKYYFPHYCSADFAEFQDDFIEYIVKNDRAYMVNECARDHAKSVLVILCAIVLKQKKKVSNIILASHNETNAIDLLTPLKLELEVNLRLIHDFGKQESLGNWTDKKIVTNDGFSARAVGAGQSPRGTRNEEARPDMIICDDIDTEEVSRNPNRIKELWEWVSGSLFGCFSIKGRKRFIIVGNRIAKDCVVLRASKEADFYQQINILTKHKRDPKYIKEIEAELAAYKNKKHPDYKILLECVRYAKLGWKPTWKERFTLFDCVYMIKKMGYRMSQREYFNNPIAEGKVFKKKWMQFKALPPMRHYLNLIAYLDPGFKKTETSDSKSLILMGMVNGEIHIRKPFCGKATTEEMIEWGYEVDKLVKRNNATYRFKMEEVFLQSLLYKDFAAVAKDKYPLPVSGDTRKKPDKDARILALEGYFERGSVYFDEQIKDDHHTEALIEQFLNFEPGVKSLKDGPDAFEGGLFYLLNAGITKAEDFTTGTYTKTYKHKI